VTPGLLPAGPRVDEDTRKVAAAVIFVASYLALAIGKIPGLSIDRAGVALVGAGLKTGIRIHQHLACECLKFRRVAYDNTPSRSDARANGCDPHPDRASATDRPIIAGTSRRPLIRLARTAAMHRLATRISIPLVNDPVASRTYPTA
jgi:hypothetical protein